MDFSRALLLSLVFASLLLTLSEAKFFIVGGKTDAWQIPSSPSDSLNKWAEENRFQIGDSLVWEFDGEKDSVLQVSRVDYLSCNASNPTAAHDGGNVTVRLEKSGPLYFISGTKGHCEKGEKLIVVVMSPRTRIGLYGISPAPSPMEFEGPAIAPTSGAIGLKGSGLVVVIGGLMALVGMVL